MQPNENNMNLVNADVLARFVFWGWQAVIVAAEDARRRLGRELPPPPQKLSNRPPRRRPAR